MSKRFTDIKKWKNQWFRELPLKAKLTWIYLCDDCESHGVCKMDWGMAKFQLDFEINPAMLKGWFGDKIHFISDEKILIVQFFEFQYGESKDTWSAKIEARKKLENLGFIIENNALVIPNELKTPTVDHSGGTSLIRGIGRVKVFKGGLGGNLDFESAYNLYPCKKGKTKGLEKLKREIDSIEELELFKTSIKNYCLDFKQNKIDIKYYKHFSTFVGEWRDWIDFKPTQNAQNGPKVSISQQQHYETLHNQNESSTGTVDVKELLKKTNIKVIK